MVARRTVRGRSWAGAGALVLALAIQACGERDRSPDAGDGDGGRTDATVPPRDAGPGDGGPDADAGDAGFDGNFDVCPMPGPGELGWARRSDGDSSQRLAGLATAGEDTVVLGSFTGGVILGPGEDRETRFATTGYSDVLLARYDVTGSLLWALSEGGGESCQTYAADVDVAPDGGIFATGTFQGETIFGRGTAAEAALNAGGRTAIFLTRHDANGALEWATRVGGDCVADPDCRRGASCGWYNITAHHVRATADGGAVLVGSFQGTVILGDGTAARTVLTAIDSYENFFFARYDAAGALRSARVIGAKGWSSTLAGFTLLADGSFALAGTFQDRVRFDPYGPRPVELITTSARPRYFLALFSATGGLSWALDEGDDAARLFASVVAALPSGDIVVGGGLAGTVTLGLGGPRTLALTGTGSITPDPLVAVYSSGGALRSAWLVPGDGSAEVTGLRTIGSDLVVAGYFFDTLAFPDGSVITSTDMYEAPDMFLARYDASQRLVWASRLGGMIVRDRTVLDLFETGDLSVGGTFSTSALFGVGQLCETELGSRSSTSLWLARVGAE